MSGTTYNISDGEFKKTFTGVEKAQIMDTNTKSEGDPSYMQMIVGRYTELYMTSTPDWTELLTDEKSDIGPTAYGPNDTLAGNSTMKNIYNFNVRAQVIFEIILFVLIVVGNLAVLIAIGLSKRGQRSRMNFFIMHLAIADLSAGLFSVLPWTIWKITREWYAGNALCKILRFSQSVVTYASTYVLVSMSIDRLDAIARPLNFTGSGLRAKILICLAWAFSVLFSLPMIFINSEGTIQGTTQCIMDFPHVWHWKLYLTLIVVAVFILPAFIITMCYSVIIYIIWSKSKYLTPDKPKKSSATFRRFNSKASNGSLPEAKECLEGTREKENKSSSSTSSRGVIPQAKIRTVKMTLVIVMVFIICWSPFFIFDLLDVYGHIPHSPSKTAISVFIQSLAPLNSVCNPIIYGIFSSRICRNLRRVRAFDWLLSRICCYCAALQAPVDRRAGSMYSTTMTQYTSMVDDRACAGAPPGTGGVPRHPNSMTLRAKLTEKENEILKKNIRNENTTTTTM